MTVTELQHTLRPTLVTDDHGYYMAIIRGIAHAA
jgi:hypothetical protein